MNNELDTLLNLLRRKMVRLRVENETLVITDEKKIIDQPTLEKLKLNKAAIINYLNYSNYGKFNFSPIEEQDYYPTSHKQSGKVLLFSLLDRCNTQSLKKDISGLNIIHTKILNSLNLDYFKLALEYVIKRNEILRTCFFIKNYVPRQRIIEQIKLKEYFEYQDWSNKNREEVEIEIKKINKINFDYWKAPLFNVFLVKFSSNCYQIFLLINHIISDFLSIQVFESELISYYTRITSDKINLLMNNKKIQFKDYATRERDFNFLAEKNILQKYEKKISSRILSEYHLKNLKSYPSYKETILKDLDKNFEHLINDEVASLFGVIHRAQFLPSNLCVFYLDAKTINSLINLVVELKVSLKSILVSALYLTLFSLSKKLKFYVGVETETRNISLIENQIMGWFSNTTLLSVNLDSNSDIKDIIQKTHQDILYFQQFLYPFEKLLSKLDLSIETIGTCWVNYTISNVSSTKIVKEINHSNTEMCSFFEIDMFITQYNNGIEIKLRYRKDLFDKKWIIKFSEKYKLIIENLASDVFSGNTNLKSYIK